MSDEVIDGLRQALALQPDNHALRRMLAERLAVGRPDEALAEWRVLLDVGALRGDALVEAGLLAVDREDLPLAERCLEQALREGRVDGVAALADRLGEARGRRGVVPLRALSPDHGPTAAAPAATPPTVRFDDVGGLDDLKKVIHRRIVLPRARPGLLERYGKRAGGGVLLYGPPGCGKTLIARATAGECGLPARVVRIDEVFGPWLGESEQNLHAAFEEARAAAPCVLFLDEVDAIGFSRSRMRGEHHRGLVDQLLQELDGTADANDGVLVLAATNAPWDLDDALLRPGRFDRTIFVPPPDGPARAAILRLHLRGRPVDGVDVDALAARTERFSGADLLALVERAFDEVLEEALVSSGEPPATMGHFEAALTAARPTTSAWLERARNYVEFAGRDDRWEDVARWLGIRRGWGLFR